MPVLIRGDGAPDKSKGLTAMAADIAWGKTALVDGQVVTGTCLPTLNNCTWEQISAISSAGLAPTCWKVGDTKTLTLTNGEAITLRIEDFDHDILADGSGKAPLTMGMLNCFASKAYINLDGTSTGGWEASELRAGMGDYMALFPAEVRGLIKPVIKDGVTDTLWLFSRSETFSPDGTPPADNYPLFTTYESRIKRVNGVANKWWLRSKGGGPLGGSQFYLLSETGVSGQGFADFNYGIALGLCI